MNDMPSKLNPSHVFNIANDDRFCLHWAWSDAVISPRIVWADCMGDGRTRHTPYAPLNSERLEEFLYTLACYMAENGCNEEIASIWPCDLEPSRIARFANLAASGRKPVYYNRSGETSTAKRCGHSSSEWTQVPEWAQGNNDAGTIYGLQRAFDPTSNSLHALHFLREARKITGIHYTVCERFLPHGLKDKWPSLDSLISICQSHIDAYKAMEKAKNEMETWEYVFLKELKPVT